VIDRRTCVQTIGAWLIAAPLAAVGQRANRTHKLGVLNILPREAALPQAVLRGLRELGYVEGKNLDVEWRSGPYEDFPALADDLVRARVDAIYAVLDQAALAASRATTTIPIVAAMLGDPVREGLVTSLAHPGGNVTGLTAYSAELGGKRLELLKEWLPRLSSVGLLWNPVSGSTVSGSPAQMGLDKTQAAARALDVELRSFAVRRPKEIDAALDLAARERVGALIVEEDSLTYAERSRIIDYMALHRIPAIYGFRDYVVSGGLLSYGARLPELIRRLLEYIDKIFKGTRPGDLPVEQPTTFELVINRKTAAALGLTVPQSLLLRADEVVE
jgi:putative ABC transport system substrate-binding protein